MNEAILKHKMECSVKWDIEKTISDFYSKLESCDKDKTKWISDLEKQLAVYNNTSKTMQEDIHEIKQTLKEFINSADEKYAKKTTTDFMIKVLWTFWWAIIFWMWGFIWNLLTNSIIWK